ncbi:MAG TPA: hypothetical protein VKI45_04200 [Allosphingosinicella sp.]|nr:hypothetical protein [Allosphingosinicella sp.]
MLPMLIALLATAPQGQPLPAVKTQAVAENAPIQIDGSRRKWNPQRVVCKDLDQPGSHLNTKRVCRSMLEWASDRREDQQVLLQKQYNGAP